MNPALVLRIAAVLGGTAVALGAFAAHGMKGHFEPEALQNFDTGVRYQMFHALALLGCACLGASRRTGAAALCFVLGTLSFSGSLYGLVVWQLRWLGPVTPIGGVLLLLGWLLLAFAPRREAAS